MEDNQYYIKLSLKYGVIGAIAFPFIYECYANVMHGIAVFLAAAGCIFVSIRFARFKVSQAASGLVFFSIISIGLGFFIELMLHDHIVSFLEKRSKYFYLTYKEIIGFAVSIFMCYVLMFIVSLGFIGARSALSKIRSNSERSQSFIDNAFGDEDE